MHPDQLRALVKGIEDSERRLEAMVSFHEFLDMVIESDMNRSVRPGQRANHFLNREDKNYVPNRVEYKIYVLGDYENDEDHAGEYDDENEVEDDDEDDEVGGEDDDKDDDDDDGDESESEEEAMQDAKRFKLNKSRTTQRAAKDYISPNHPSRTRQRHDGRQSDSRRGFPYSITCGYTSTVSPSFPTRQPS